MGVPSFLKRNWLVCSAFGLGALWFFWKLPARGHRARVHLKDMWSSCQNFTNEHVAAPGQAILSEIFQKTPNCQNGRLRNTHKRWSACSLTLPETHAQNSLWMNARNFPNRWTC